LSPHPTPIAITRDSRHKRRATGGRRHPHQKKRKFEVGRPPSMTKMGPKRIHLVRTRGGSLKHRAIRLETGNFSWGSENITKRTRILDVLYNASNNELVRTKTLVKNAVVSIDATPFLTYYKNHYRKTVVKQAKEGKDGLNYSVEDFVPEGGNTGKRISARYAKAAEKKGTIVSAPMGPLVGRLLLFLSDPRFFTRSPSSRVLTTHLPPLPTLSPPQVDPKIEEQFVTGKVLAVLSSRPGQSGRADGYLLEGPELAFYQRQLNLKKAGKAK